MAPDNRDEHGPAATQHPEGFEPPEGLEPLEEYVPLDPVRVPGLATIELPLLPLTTDTGTVRSDGEHLPQATQFKNGGFVVTVREAAIVHGYYTGEAPEKGSPEPASLLVYHWELNGGGARKISDGREIHAIDLTLRFEASPLGEPADDPWLAGYFPAPGNAGFKFKALNVENFENKTKGGGASAKAGAKEASLGVFAFLTKAVGKEYKSVEDAVCKSTATRTQSRGGGRGGDDTVTWTLSDNGLTSSLPDMFAVAVVIKRPGTMKSNQFNVSFDIDAVVDRKHNWSVKLGKMSEGLRIPWNRKSKHDKIYSSTESTEQPKQLKDKNFLKNEVIKYSLRKYVIFHLPEEGQPTELFSTRKNKGKGKQNMKNGSERQEKEAGQQGNGEEGKDGGGGPKGGGDEEGKEEADDDGKEDDENDKDDETEDDDEDDFEDALEDLADQDMGGVMVDDGSDDTEDD